jgi:hypothetical protein
MRTTMGSDTDAPRRIQRQRIKGWQMPPNTVYVGRPSKWANPYPIGGWVQRDDEERWPHVARLIPGGPQALGIPFVQVRVISAEMAVQAYFDYIVERPGLFLAAAEELRGKNLACWCRVDHPCHGDVLLEIASDD